MKHSFTAALLLSTCTAGFSQQIITQDAEPLNMRTASNNVTVFVGLNTAEASGGGSNTFVGFQAGQGTTSGTQNTFVGCRAGLPNTVGSRNTFVGYQIGQLNIDGSDNVFMGYNTGGRNRRGDRNIGIGVGAGLFGDEGSDNTLIGSNAVGEGVALTNATAIGANAKVLTSNALVLGSRANVGIGTSAPQQKLEVVSEQADQSGLRLSRLTSASPAVRTTDQFLTVSEQGDVVLSRYKVKVNNSAEWSDRVFEPGYSLRSLAEVERFINANKHLPGIPSANEMMETGIDATQLNAKLLEKIEELTLHLISLTKADQQKNRRIDQLEKQIEQLNKRLPRTR
ncbi:hypothetical protein [Spirosoma fluminis]